jgi:hypothetical protein
MYLISVTSSLASCPYCHRQVLPEHLSVHFTTECVTKFKLVQIEMSNNYPVFKLTDSNTAVIVKKQPGQANDPQCIVLLMANTPKVCWDVAAVHMTYTCYCFYILKLPRNFPTGQAKQQLTLSYRYNHVNYRIQLPINSLADINHGVGYVSLETKNRLTLDDIWDDIQTSVCKYYCKLELNRSAKQKDFVYEILLEMTTKLLSPVE